MRYFLIVGEASADLHAANLAKAIRSLDDSAEFMYIGGDLMATATGTPPIVHYRELAFMGFGPVLRNFHKIYRAKRKLKQEMASFAPDIVIPVDYAGFNIRYTLPLAQRLGIPTAYYIAPKLWAWKKWRMKQLRRYVKELLCILPFEEEFFAKHGIASHYIGNPTVDATRETWERLQRGELIKRPQIAILAGSRRQELASNLETMLQATATLSDSYRIVVAGAPGLTSQDYAPFIENYPHIDLVFGDTHRLVAESLVALVTSGTATLETALLDTPQIVCYRMGGQRWLRWVWDHCFQTKFISLVNIITDRAVVPELIGDEVEVLHLRTLVTQLLNAQDMRQAQHLGYATLRDILGNEETSMRAARRIVSLAQQQSREQQS